MMKTAKDTKLNYSVMYGFNKTTPDDVGYLKIVQNGSGDYGIYSIVDNLEDATRFIRGIQDNALDFINSEDELSSWKFHFVKTMS